MWSNFKVKTHFGLKSVFEGKILDITQYLAFFYSVIYFYHFVGTIQYTMVEYLQYFLNVGFVILFFISLTELLLLYIKVE